MIIESKKISHCYCDYNETKNPGCEAVTKSVTWELAWCCYIIAETSLSRFFFCCCIFSSDSISFTYMCENPNYSSWISLTFPSLKDISKKINQICLVQLKCQNFPLTTNLWHLNSFLFFFFYIKLNLKIITNIFILARCLNPVLIGPK